jgi:hypothetical protein
MPSPFDTDFAHADALFAEAFGVSVQIVREANPPTPATAEVVLREQRIDQAAEEPPDALHDREYLIAVTDYKVADVAVKPRNGDRIHETINGTLYKFEVLPDDRREGAEWADPAGTRWLIRTKKVS